MALMLLPKDTYLAMIRNSVGSNLFRNSYALEGEERKDILRDGDLSCAFFVSVVLYIVRFIQSPHATVSGLERDLQNSGWTTTETPKEGDVLVWESAAQAGGEMHPHAGFYIGNDEAISNSDSAKSPVRHHITFGKKEDGSPVRKLTAVYTHAMLT